MRVLVIGLDGMAPGFLDHWADEGRLPFLGAIRDDGVSGILESTVPPYTPTAWTSIVTGVNPGRHGVFGFTRWTPRGREALVDAERCRAKTIWDVLSEWGRGSVVINVPITYPPRPIRGVLVSGMGTPSDAEDWAYPAGLVETIRAAAPGYVTDVPVTNRTVRRSGRAAVRAIAEATDRRLRAAGALLAQEDWEFAMLVLEAPDRLQHLFWGAIAPEAPDSALRERVLAEYTRLDRGLAAIVERAERDGPLAVLIVSDHGFDELRWDLYLNNHLAGAGLLALAPAPAVRLARRLPAPLRRAATRLYRGAVDDPLAASHSRAFDWERTVAFAGRAFEQGVYVRGGEEERERTVAALADLATPDGEAAVERVAPREELYRGPFVEEAPDLFPRFRVPGVVINPGLAEPRVWRSPGPSLRGTHHPDGILLARGPGIGRAAGVAARAQDVAPTVYRLLGHGVPAGLDGRPIPGVGAGPDREVTVDLDRTAGASGYGPEQEREIADRLRALGYLE